MATFTYGGVINPPRDRRVGINGKPFAFGGSNYNGNNNSASHARNYVKINLAYNTTTSSYRWFQVKAVARMAQGKNFPSNTTTTIVQGGSTTLNVYRGRIGGNYVYNIGTPPLNATDIVVIGTVVS